MDVSTPLPRIFFNRGAEKQPDTPRHISKKKDQDANKPYNI